MRASRRQEHVLVLVLPGHQSMRERSNARHAVTQRAVYTIVVECIDQRNLREPSRAVRHTTEVRNIDLFRPSLEGNEPLSNVFVWRVEPKSFLV